MTKKVRMIHEFSESNGYQKLLGLKMYDLRGRLVRNFTLNENGEVTEETLHRFDKSGQLIETITIKGSRNVARTSSLYNDEGDLVERTFDSDGYQSVVKYVFEHEKTGVFASKSYAEYLGNRLNITRLNELGDPIERIVKTTCYKSDYDSFNDYDDDIFFKVDYKVKFEYDDRGELLSETTICHNCKINGYENIKVKYDINTGGYSKISTRQIAEEDWESATEEYNHKDELISKQIATVGTEYNFSYEYTYDESNNWIEKKEILNNEVRMVVKRIITYFLDSRS